MASWIRSNNSALSITGANLTGDMSLSNGTAPADFDPAGISSIEVTVIITGSSFGDDTWAHHNGWLLVDSSNNILANAIGVESAGHKNTSVQLALTDTTSLTGFTTTQWEQAKLRQASEWATYSQNMSPDGGVLTIAANNATVNISYTPLAVATLDQVGFRFRNDDGSESAATWMAAENTDVTSIGLDQDFRLRFVVDETGGAAFTDDFSLQYQRNGGAWTTVTLFEPMKIGVSSHVADAEATTRQLTGGTGAFTAGQICESPDALTGVFTIGAGNLTEIEWVLLASSSDGAQVGDVFNLRVIVPGGTLDAYTVADATMTVASGSLSLTGTTFTKAPTFPTGAISNNVFLDGVTFTKAPTFPAGGTVQPAPSPLTGVLFTSAPSFGVGTVTPGAVTVSGVAFTRAPTFPQGSVTPGAVALTGTTFTRAPTFPAGGTVQPAPTPLTGTLFTSAPSFGVGTVTPGAVALTGTTFARAPTFGVGAISIGAVTLTGTLFTKAPSFGTGTVDATYALSGVTFTRAPSFGVGAVSAGAVALTGTLFTSAPSFGVGVVEVGALTLSGSTFVKAPTFLEGDMNLGETVAWVGATPADGTDYAVFIAADVLEYNFPTISHDEWSITRLRGLEAKRYKFTSSIENWRAEFQSTVAHSAAYGALAMTLSATGVNSAIESVPSRSLADLQAHAVAVTPGETYRALWRATLDPANTPPTAFTAPLSARFYFYNSSGTFIAQDSTGESGPSFQADATDMQSYKYRVSSADLTVPANAAFMIVNMYTSTAFTAGDIIYLDEFVLAEVDFATYGDAVQGYSYTGLTWGARVSASGADSRDTVTTPTNHLEGVPGQNLPSNFEVWYIADMIPAQSVAGGVSKRLYTATPITSVRPSFTQWLTGTTFTKAPTFPAGVIEAAGFLAGTTFVSAPTFGAGTITPGAVALTGSTFVKAPTFGAGTVTAGAVALTGSTFVSAPTFGGGVIASGVVLTGTTFTRAPTFGTGTVTPGAVALSGSTFVTAPTFGVGSITTGAVTLVGSTFVSAPTFPTGAIAGDESIVGFVFVSTPSFGVGTITTGPVALTGTTFSSAPSFGAGTVAATYALTGTTFVKAPTFGIGAVMPDQLVSGALFTSAPSFGIGAITAGPVALTGTLFTSAPTFGVGIVNVGNTQILAGILFQASPSFHQGGISAGPVTVTGSLLTVAPSFGVGRLLVAQDLPGDQGASTDRGRLGLSTDRGRYGGTTSGSSRGSTNDRGSRGYTDP